MKTIANIVNIGSVTVVLGVSLIVHFFMDDGLAGSVMASSEDKRGICQWNCSEYEEEITRLEQRVEKIR
jgi:hypothetical protein